MKILKILSYCSTIGLFSLFFFMLVIGPMWREHQRKEIMKNVRKAEAIIAKVEAMGY